MSGAAAGVAAGFSATCSCLHATTTKRRSRAASRLMAASIREGGFSFANRRVKRNVAEVASFPTAEPERANVSTPSPWEEERTLLAAIRAGDQVAAEEL